MNIGQLIKTERQRQNIKQDALAEGICSPSHLSKIENGQTLPSERIQQRLLTRLNLSITESDNNLSAEEFNRFKERFSKVINHRNKNEAKLFCSDIKDFLNKHPLYKNKFSLLLMENRLLLLTEERLDIIKKNISVFISIKDELTSKQRFHLNIIEGIIAYRENRFNNALHISQ